MPTLAATDMTVFTLQTYDPIARMNAAKDMHRARGTSGGKAARTITDKDRAVRDAGLACHEPPHSLAQHYCVAV